MSARSWVIARLDRHEPRQNGGPDCGDRGTARRNGERTRRKGIRFRPALVNLVRLTRCVAVPCPVTSTLESKQLWCEPVLLPLQSPGLRASSDEPK
jgi:hypothetical protein